MIRCRNETFIFEHQQATMTPSRARGQHGSAVIHSAMRTVGLLFGAAMCLCANRVGAQADTSRAGSPPPKEVHDVSGHGHGIDPLFAVHFGFPTAASVSLGGEVWLGDHVPGAVFADVEPGAFAVRYAIGYLQSNGAILPTGNRYPA
jgi:hypothetical protein